MFMLIALDVATLYIYLMIKTIVIICCIWSQYNNGYDINKF